MSSVCGTDSAQCLNNGKSDYKHSGVLSSSNKSSGFGMSIYPTAGYFITDKFVVGASLNIGFSNYKYDYSNSLGQKTTDSKSSDFSLGLDPFVRYYFPGKEKLRFYGQIQGGVDTELSYNSESTSYNTSTGVADFKYKTNYLTKPKTVSVGALFGLNYFLSENVALNTSLGYYYSKYTYEYNDETTDLATNATTTGTNFGYSNNSGNIRWSIGFTKIIGSGGKSTEK